MFLDGIIKVIKSWDANSEIIDEPGIEALRHKALADILSLVVTMDLIVTDKGIDLIKGLISDYDWDLLTDPELIKVDIMQIVMLVAVDTLAYYLNDNKPCDKILAVKHNIIDSLSYSSYIKKARFQEFKDVLSDITVESGDQQESIRNVIMNSPGETAMFI